MTMVRVDTGYQVILYRTENKMFRTKTAPNLQNYDPHLRYHLISSGLLFFPFFLILIIHYRLQYFLLFLSIFIGYSLLYRRQKIISHKEKNNFRKSISHKKNKIRK